MDAQELRNLQEAYMEIVEGREGGRFEYNQRHGRPLITPEISQRASSQETLGGGTYERGPKRLPKSKRKYDRQVLSGVRAASEQEKQRARKRMGIKEDIYDIILSHLLDEGYAETPEAAEAIMVNMSEDWRESIVEEVLDEAAIYKRGGKGQTTETPLQIYGKSATTREKKKLHNIPKGRIGANEVGDYDRGSGNAAKRRAAALTKPEVKKFPNRLTRSDGQGIKDSYEYDLYDTILEHLVAEGYADTNESALVIMANMSEEWRHSIIDEGKVELKQRNKNEMQRKAGNLGREVVSTPNTKKNAVKRGAAMNRMGKLVSAIASDDEDKRFDRMPTSR